MTGAWRKTWVSLRAEKAAACQGTSHWEWSGVYRLFVDGQEIGRLLGQDPTGTLYIGMAGHGSRQWSIMRSRIMGLANRRNHHVVDRWFFNEKLEKRFPWRLWMVQWAFTKRRTNYMGDETSGARSAESLLLNSYRDSFGELSSDEREDLTTRRPCLISGKFSSALTEKGESSRLPFRSEEAMNNRRDCPKASSHVEFHLNIDAKFWLHQPALRAGRASTHRVEGLAAIGTVQTAVHVLASACSPRYVSLQAVPCLFWYPACIPQAKLDRQIPSDVSQHGLAVIVAG